MDLGLTDILVLLGVLQGLVMGGAILLIPYFRSVANRYLGWFMLLLSGIIFMAWQEFDWWWLDFIWSIMWEYLLMGLLLRYFLEALRHPLRHHPASWAFFWLFGSVFVVDIAIDLSFLFGWYELPFSADNRHYKFFEKFEDLLTYWLFFFTVSGSLFLVWQDRILPPEKRRWLLQFCFLLLGIAAVWFCVNSVNLYYASELPFVVLLLTMSVVFWWVGYWGVYRQRIAEERSAIRTLRQARTVPAASVAAGNTYTRQLQQLMEEEELFRNPDLGRSTVAERLGISEGYLSEQMREELGEGFVEYINGFRVRAARVMLTDVAFGPYSLEAIGQEAGFKSRSAFYSSFKKATGQTPGGYRKAAKLS